MGDSKVAVIVEHDVDTRDLYVTVLQRAGFVVAAVGTVAAARAVLATVDADLLLTDYSLPDGTGREVLAASSTKPRLCILLSGFDAVDVDGADFHLVLTKPITSTAFLEAILDHGG